MALSEREQQMLQELEEQLQSEDPTFAHSMEDAPTGRVNVRNLVLGLLIAVAGLGVLLFSIYSQWIPVGVLGFLIMGAGVYYATTGGAPSNGSGTSRGKGNGGGSGGSGGGGPRSSEPNPSSSLFSS